MQAPTELIQIDIYPDFVAIIVGAERTVVNRASSISVSQWEQYWERAIQGTTQSPWRKL